MVQEKKLVAAYKASSHVDWEDGITICLVKKLGILINLF
jgi:hypothetical protein